MHSLGVVVRTAHHRDRPGVRKAAHTVVGRTEAARKPGLEAGTVHTAVPCWGPGEDSLLAEVGSHPVAEDSLLVLVDSPCCPSRTWGSLVVVLPCWLCQYSVAAEAEVVWKVTDEAATIVVIAERDTACVVKRVVSHGESKSQDSDNHPSLRSASASSSPPTALPISNVDNETLPTCPAFQNLNDA